MKSIKTSTCIIAALLIVCGNTFATTKTTASADMVMDTALADIVVEDRYYDAPIGGSRLAPGESEIITFAWSDDTYIGLPNNVPYYHNIEGYDNSCGAIAGSIVVGYYDKYLQNLMPDYTNYYPATGKYRPQDSTHYPVLLQSMYTLMQTNVTGPGVTQTECMNGLEAYVEGKGYSIDYTAVKPLNGNFNDNIYKNAINNGQPVLLFCDAIELLSSDSGETQNEFMVSQVSQDHIMVGFGYRVIRYYDESDVNFRTDIYLKVASGWNPNDMGYIHLNDDSCLDSAYAVHIY